LGSGDSKPAISGFRQTKAEAVDHFTTTSDSRTLMMNTRRSLQQKRADRRSQWWAGSSSDRESRMNGPNQRNETLVSFVGLSPLSHHSAEEGRSTATVLLPTSLHSFFPQSPTQSKLVSSNNGGIRHAPFRCFPGSASAHEGLRSRVAIVLSQHCRAHAAT